MKLKDVEFENPKKYLCYNIFSVDIDFINNPNLSGDGNWGTYEIEFNISFNLQTWRQDILDTWVEFCKENKWDADKVEIVDAWITYPDVDDLIDEFNEDWKEYDDGKMTVEERNRCSRP